MKRYCLVPALLALAGGGALAQEGPGGPPAEPPAATAQPAAAEPSQGGYEVRLKSLREQVDDLKGRVFDSKTRLMVLGEQILNNLIAEARAVIIHENDASSMLTLEEVLYFLDNQKIYYQSNREGTLDTQREFSIFDGSISPGNHVLSVELVYRGNGKVFTYLSGYVFRVKSAFNFFAAKGYETRVRSVGYEKGGLTTPFEERPSVRFELQHTKIAADAGGEGTGAPQGPQGQ